MSVFVVGLVLVITSFSVSADSDEEYDFSQERASVYSIDFSERFVLPNENRTEQLDEAINAIHFSVEKNPHKSRNKYSCALKFYINSQMPIAYPVEGDVGSESVVMTKEHFIFDDVARGKKFKELDADDSRQFLRSNTYRLMAFLHAGRRISSLSMSSFKKNIFTGINYLKYDVSCYGLSSSKVKDVVIWIKKDDAKDNSRRVRQDPDDFIHITLPEKFVNKIKVIAKKTAAINKVLR